MSNPKKDAVASHGGACVPGAWCDSGRRRTWSCAHRWSSSSFFAFLGFTFEEKEVTKEWA